MPLGSTEVVERPGAVRRSAAGAGGRPTPAWLELLGRYGLPFAVAAAVFYLALKGGAYALGIRSPAAIAVWAVLAVGTAIGFLPRVRLPRAVLVLAGLLAAFAALQGLSAAWGDSAEKALLELDRVALYVGVFALVVLYARAASAPQWSDGLAFGLAAVGLLALSHRLLPDVFGSSAIDAFNPGDPRLSYPVNYWNGLSALIALGLPLLLRSATEARGRLAAALVIAPLPALVAAMYLTSSRGGAAAGLLAIATFVVLTSRRVPALAASVAALAGSAVAIVCLRAQDELVGGPLDADVVPDQGRTALILIVLTCVVTAAAYALLRPRVPERIHVSRTVKRAAAVAALITLVAGVVAADPASRFEDLKKPPEQFDANYVQSHIVSTSGNGRWQFWGAAVDQFENDPLLGGGAGSYEAWWAQHGTLDYFTRNAHSLFLETMAELGLVGLMLLLGLVGTGAVVALRRVRSTPGGDRPVVAALAGAFAAFVFAVGTDWAWDLTVIGVVGIACLALLAGPATQFPARPSARRFSLADARRGIGWRVVAVLLALLVAAGAAVPWLTERRIRDSERHLEAGNAPEALESARDARAIQPWAASAHLQLALVHEYRQDFDEARQSIGDAIERYRSDWQLWIVASRIDEARGDLDAARREFDRARSLNPRSAYFDEAQRPGDDR